MFTFYLFSVVVYMDWVTVLASIIGSFGVILGSIDKYSPHPVIHLEFIALTELKAERKGFHDEHIDANIAPNL